jgi:nucleotide-binding universal stress UspA family protein
MKATNGSPKASPSSSPATPEAAAAAPKEILVAIDFSKASVTALRHAAEIATKEGAHLTVLNVVIEPPSFRSLDLARRERRERLDHTLQLRKFTRRELGPDNHAQLMVCRGEPSAEIARVAAHQHASLVVVGRHEHHGLARWWHGRTVSRVVRRAPCPVIVMN